MGWKSFSQLFNHTREVEISDMSGMTIAIDAMTEIYRGALATKNVGALTDSNGNPTIHITVVLSTIMDFINNKVNQIWVFDYNQQPNKAFHNAAKLGELAKRKVKKDKALTALKELFSDSDEDYESDTEETTNQSKRQVDSDEETVVTKKETIAKLKVQKRLALEKQAFTVSAAMINDVKIILDGLNIPYMEAPEGFEGEGVASYLNKTGVVDAVFSGDTDSIAYGATKLFRRVPIKKAIYEYTYDDIMEQVKEKNDDLAKYDIDLLIKCALIMGTDFCEKTPGIGPKTVFKKIEYIDLTPEQEKAFIEFKKEPDMSKVLKSTESASNKEDLINWLVNERQFDKARITKKLEFVDYTALHKKVSKSAPRAKPIEKQKIVKRTIKSTK